MSYCAIGATYAIGGAIAYVNLCHIGLYLVGLGRGGITCGLSDEELRRSLYWA